MATPPAAPPPRPSYASVQDPETTAQAGVQPAPPPPDDGVEKVAVIVTHGMGQQVPFETLELLANAVRTEAANCNPGAPPPPVVTRVVRLGTKGDPRSPSSRAPNCAFFFRTARRATSIFTKSTGRLSPKEK